MEEDGEVRWNFRGRRIEGRVLLTVNAPHCKSSDKKKRNWVLISEVVSFRVSLIRAAKTVSLS